MLIKIIIIIPLALVMLLFTLGRNKRVLTRLALLGITFTGIIFVVFDNTAQKLADIFGVTRGTDFVFYIAVLAFFLMILQLYNRQSETERTLTNLARSQAISNAKKLDTKPTQEANTEA